jgi:Dolichyl-phosphate-mannose-protein mannosyltransferase
LLLASFGAARSPMTKVIVFQHLLRVLLVVGATAAAWRISKSGRVAGIAAALMIIDFPLLEAANSILTELLFTVLISIVYWLFWRSRSAWELALAGFMAGAAVLVRPVGLYFIFPAILFLVITHRGPGLNLLKTTGAFAMCFALIPCLWSVRNEREIGRFTVSTVPGYSMLQYKAAGSIAMDQPGDFRRNFEVAQKQVEQQACSRRDCTAMSPAERSDYFYTFGVDAIRHHRRGLVLSTARGIAVMLLDGGANTMTWLFGTSWPRGMRIMLAYTVPILAAALYGLVRCWRRNWRFFWFALVIIGYFVVVSAGPEAYGRFRLPFLPIYALLAANGIEALWSKLDNRFRTAASRFVT